MESYRFRVRGRVQGVGFRMATQREAAALGLAGWVRNEPEGSVEGEVWGADPAALARFRDWLREGPPGARVDALEWQREDSAAAVPAVGFLVRR